MAVKICTAVIVPDAAAAIVKGKFAMAINNGVGRAFFGGFVRFVRSQTPPRLSLHVGLYLFHSRLCCLATGLATISPSILYLVSYEGPILWPKLPWYLQRNS